MVRTYITYEHAHGVPRETFYLRPGDLVGRMLISTLLSAMHRFLTYFRPKQNCCHFADDMIDVFYRTEILLVFWVEFHCSFFLMFNWQQVIVGSCKGLACNRRQAIVRTNVKQDALGFNELIHMINTYSLHIAQSNSYYQPNTTAHWHIVKQLLPANLQSFFFNKIMIFFMGFPLENLPWCFEMNW